MQEQRSACDSCRRRKVGCDSGQPCRKCVDNGLLCTYGSSRRRGLATMYVRTLEQQVAELQNQLQAAAPEPTQPPIDLLVHAGGDLVVQQSTGSRVYRFSAALNILRTIADMVDAGLSPSNESGPPGLAIVEAIDAPLQLPASDPMDWLDVVLPAVDELQRLVTCAIDRALVCHHCIDRKAFQTRINDLGDAAIAREMAKNKPFMAKLYAALALGERYTTGTPNDPNERPAGFQYYRASRCVSHADPDPCELDHVVARILQSRYLLSVSHISEAHSTLCKGISVATHMGLHFDDSSLQGRYTQAELDERRMVFAVLYMMDTYISFILGLPRTLTYAHSKQTLGLRSEDLHDGGQTLLSRDGLTPTTETIISQKMFHIYARILDRQSGQRSSDHWIASDWVSDIQRDFANWENLLPDFPRDSTNKRALLGQLTLRMHYSGAQIMLYAPCIHHLAKERSDADFDVDGFTYGSNCVRAAAQYVLLAEILEAQDIIVPATSWMVGFVLTLATSVLAYFVMCSKARITIEENKSTIVKAARILAALGETNLSNRRIYDRLRPYIDIVLNSNG